MVKAFSGLWNKFAADIESIREREPEIEPALREVPNPPALREVPNPPALREVPNPIEEILVLVRQQAQMAAAPLSSSPLLRQMLKYFEDLREDLFVEFRREIINEVSRISSLPNDDPYAWRDLSERWKSVLDAWTQLMESTKQSGLGMIEVRLLDSIVQLRKPIEFLLDLRSAAELSSGVGGAEPDSAHLIGRASKPEFFGRSVVPEGREKGRKGTE